MTDRRTLMTEAHRMARDSLALDAQFHRNQHSGAIRYGSPYPAHRPRPYAAALREALRETWKRVRRSAALARAPAELRLAAERAEVRLLIEQVRDQRDPELLLAAWSAAEAARAAVLGA